MQAASAPDYRRRIWVAAACAFALGMIALSWVGYIESDDFSYARAAEAWLSHPPFLGRSQWALRHMIVLPLAASFQIFGRSETSLAAPMLLYGVALLLMMGFGVRRVAGPVAGILAPLLIATVPAFATCATLVSSDMAEAFYVLASLWVFYFATEADRRWMFVAAGVLAGCGFLTRETTLALLLLYGVLFVAGYGRRSNYFWMGGGFVLVAALETAYLWSMSGDPLWRIHVALTGVGNDSPYTPGLLQTSGTFDQHGVLRASRPVQGLLLLFASQGIGLLPWFGVPAAAFLAWRPPQGEAGRATRLFALLALTWFVVLSYVFLFLWLIPRYQIVALCALAVPSSIVLATWLKEGRRWRVAAVLAPIMGMGVLLAAAADHGILSGERALVGFVRMNGHAVRTDPGTLEGAEWLLEIAGLNNLVSAEPPKPGGLYFLNHAPRRTIPADWPAPPAGSKVVADFSQPPSLVARALRVLGLLRILPAALQAKLLPTRSAEVLQIP